ncbi:hypothetical protein LCGC14_0472140 [marine sediment metagenome]|uniref:3'-5' exoribonuclease Rv2179c-like domain-containing protein n=1 Tax=marine sediment metagenome TaxID=412755 RepID=A0A0F9SUU2_9ZZZZ
MTESVFERALIAADEHPYIQGTFPYHHVMLDLETMGLPPRGAIISIGLCYFDIRTGEIGPTFERNIALDSSVERGMTIDQGCVDFWNQSDTQVAFEILKQDPVRLEVALMELIDFITEHKKHPCLWGNGSNFDNVILEQAFKLCDLHFIAHFRQWRDMRTWVMLGAKLLGMNKAEMRADFNDEGFRKHVAIDDAILQAKIVSRIWQEAKRRIS